MDKTLQRSKKVFPITLNLLAQTLIVAGILMVSLSILLALSRINPRRLNFYRIPQTLNNESIETADSHLSRPKYITIAGTSISLPIIPSTIEDQTWETTEEGVSYLTMSPVPGEKGNSILYGHNWTDLLGPLMDVKPGQTIRIRYEDETQKTFMVENTATVSPNDTSILMASAEPMMTIYTCTGLFDSKRFVVTARPI
jgi:LPXTG-site transpeptidase (sortase) family protein